MVYQYFYKNNDCQANTADDPNCICWHDEGTGPLHYKRHDDPDASVKNWRNMTLKIGDRVRIKSVDEIKKTLNHGYNHSCSFPEQMHKYCNTVDVIVRTTFIGNFNVSSSDFAWSEHWLEPVNTIILDDDLFTIN